MPDTSKKRGQPPTNFQQQDATAHLPGGVRCTGSLHSISFWLSLFRCVPLKKDLTLRNHSVACSHQGVGGGGVSMVSEMSIFLRNVHKEASDTMQWSCWAQRETEGPPGVRRGDSGSGVLELEWCISEKVNVLVMWGQRTACAPVHHSRQRLTTITGEMDSRGGGGLFELGYMRTLGQFTQTDKISLTSSNVTSSTPGSRDMT